MARITFQSSTFSGTETSEVISATVEIAGGIVSSRDIDVPISFTPGTALGNNISKGKFTHVGSQLGKIYGVLYKIQLYVAGRIWAVKHFIYNCSC